jgi:hypothetical protein
MTDRERTKRFHASDNSGLARWSNFSLAMFAEGLMVECATRGKGKVLPKPIERSVKREYLIATCWFGKRRKKWLRRNMVSFPTPPPLRWDAVAVAVAATLDPREEEASNLAAVAADAADDNLIVAAAAVA